MLIQEIIDKISSLPEHLRQEVLDFVDFITSKYKLYTKSALTSEQQEELDRRYILLQENSNRGIEWKEANTSLKNKYGL